MKPRLCLVVPAFDQGGGVPSVAMFIRRIALAAGLHDVRVVSLATAADDADSLRLAHPRTWGTHPRNSAGEWSGVRFEHVGAVLPEFEFQRYRPRAALARVLTDCDVIQMVSGSPAWANAVLGLGKPVALHVATRARVERQARDSAPKRLKGWWRKGMTEVTDRLDDRALRRVDAIQVMNPWMLDYAHTINANRNVDIRYAPPGIDADCYRPLNATARMRDPYVLCVGRLNDPRKNPDLLLEAFARMPVHVRERTRLVLAGSSAPVDAFWQRAELLGLRDRVAFVPRPDRACLLELYQQANVFALPSDEEGFGMVVIEAMACGVPVVSTRSGGPDGIISDGKDGFLTPLNDAETMSARLCELLEQAELNRAMGEAARLTIALRYDERVAGAAFLEVWDRLLHKASAR